MLAALFQGSCGSTDLLEVLDGPLAGDDRLNKETCTPQGVKRQLYTPTVVCKVQNREHPDGRTAREQTLEQGRVQEGDTGDSGRDNQPKGKDKINDCQQSKIEGKASQTARLGECGREKRREMPLKKATEESRTGPTQVGKQGEAAVLDLLDLQLGEGVGVIG